MNGRGIIFSSYSLAVDSFAIRRIGILHLMAATYAGLVASDSWTHCASRAAMIRHTPPAITA